MLYYRTHASRPERRPPELEGWAGGVAAYEMAENQHGEHRVIGIVQPLQFAPPEQGWTPIGNGWDVCLVGEFLPAVMANQKSPWKVQTEQHGGNAWFFPIILHPNGSRAFEVRYGGLDFLPMLSEQQAAMVALAGEVKTCMDSGNWPDMSVRARWAARLLSLPYHLSPATIAAAGILTEGIIAGALMTAVGHGGQAE